MSPQKVPWRHRWGVQVHLYSFVTSAPDGVGGECHTRAALRWEKAPVLIVQEATWTPEPAETIVKKRKPRALNGVRTPSYTGRAARSKSLNQLRSPGQ